MKSKELNSESTISRRSLLVASGGAVVAGLVGAQPLQANSNKSEIEFWNRFVGQRFSGKSQATGEEVSDSFGKAVRTKLQLIEVKEMTADDPHRPRNMRKPFSLIFKNENAHDSFQTANYSLNNGSAGSRSMFLTEVMDMELGEMVIEAVWA